MPTTTTANTSVVLVDTASGSPPYIVYFPYNNNVGSIITVRDNDGYASTGNSIVLSTITGTSFSGNQSTIFINQPYGYITFSVKSDGTYDILNTFAFPTGSDSAYVYNLNTNILKIQDNSNKNIFNTLTTSTTHLYYNYEQVGDVTKSILDNSLNNLSNNVINLSNNIQSQLRQTTVTRIYVTVGTANIDNVEGTIQFSDDLGVNWYNAIKGTRGFYNGGIDISVNNIGYYVACGDNSSTDPTINSTNLGYIQWSFDGKSWFNSMTPELSKNQIRNRIYYAAGIWHAIGSDSGNKSILWSKDNINWCNSYSSYSLFDQASIYTGIAYNNNLWVCCGSNSYSPTEDSYSLVWSKDGSNWNINDIFDNNSYFYDIAYTGTHFIVLASNLLYKNILVSSTGSNAWNSPTTNNNLNNESGYLATNNIITLLVTTSFHKYSLDNGNNWINMENFPSGKPSRPYYDGSAWWVGLQNNPYNTFTSGNGISWSPYINSITTNILYPNGYLTGMVAVNVSSNLNIQLISTVYGLEQSFYTKSLNAQTISIDSFMFKSINNNTITITNNTLNEILKVNNISTTYIETDNFNTKRISADSLSINNLTVTVQQNANYILASTITASTIYIDYSYHSTIFASTIYSSDFIDTIFLNANNISSLKVYTSSLIASDSISTSQISSDNINVNKLNVLSANIDNLYVKTSYLNLMYGDIISTNNAVISTIQLTDYDGSLHQLNTSNHNLYFDGNVINTNSTNPLYFRYTLIDTSGATPTLTQFSITTARSSGNLNDIETLNISVQDISSKLLSGFFHNVAANSILHLLNTALGSDHIYRIDSIQPSASADLFLLKVTLLSGNNQIAVINNVYNMFIESIGIPPPINSPDNIVLIYAKASGGGFNFTIGDAYVIIPEKVGTYLPGTATGSQFGINLNGNTYSSSRIPALIGSITYYTYGGFIVANVKCGSISPTNGGYITIDSGVQVITMSGLTQANFPGAKNDLGQGYSIYITLQFLN